MKTVKQIEELIMDGKYKVFLALNKKSPIETEVIYHVTEVESGEKVLDDFISTMYFEEFDDLTIISDTWVAEYGILSENKLGALRIFFNESDGTLEARSYYNTKSSYEPGIRPTTQEDWLEDSDYVYYYFRDRADTCSPTRTLDPVDFGISFDSNKVFMVSTILDKDRLIVTFVLNPKFKQLVLEAEPQFVVKQGYVVQNVTAVKFVYPYSEDMMTKLIADLKRLNDVLEND